MALPASGTISFSDLQSEWNTSTPISMSSFLAGGAYVGTNAITVPASGAVGLSNFYSISNAWGQILNLTGATSTDYLPIKGVCVDSSNNVIVCGQYSNNGASPAVGSTFLAKFNTYGNLLWQKSITNTSTYLEDIKFVKTDSSGNIYIVGNNLTGTASFLISKYNSDGSFLWTSSIVPQYFGQGTATTALAFNFTIDSSNNLYVVGSISGSSVAGCVVKIDSSGNTTWFRTLYPSFGSGFTGLIKSVAVDSSGNVYLGGESNGTIGLIFITRLDSTGATIGNTFYSSYDTLTSAVVCPNGNISFLSGTRIITINSGGTIQWARSVTNTGSSAAVLSVDSSSNLYGALEGGLFFKIDSSGTVVWQRQYGGSNPNYYEIRNSALDSNQNLYTITTGPTSVSGINFGSWAVRKTFSGAYLPASVALYNSAVATYNIGAGTFGSTTINPNTTGFTLNNNAGSATPSLTTYTVSVASNSFVLSNSAY